MTIPLRPGRICANHQFFRFQHAAPIVMRFINGYAFCRALPGRCGVVAVPNVVFYDDKDAGRPLVRFAFCKRDEVLDEALTRLKGLRA